MEDHNTPEYVKLSEYVKLYHKMQEAWEQLLTHTDYLPINQHCPEYAKFIEAELKARRYYIDWHASGNMRYKPSHNTEVIYPRPINRKIAKQGD